MYLNLKEILSQLDLDQLDVLHRQLDLNKLSSSAIGGKTPLEVWLLRKAAQDYDSLRVFGCPTYYHVKEDKLDPKAKMLCLLDSRKEYKATRFRILKDKKFILSGDVTFDEASMLKPTIFQ